MLVRDHMALTIAATTYRHPGLRDRDALERTGWTPTRFWQRINALIDDPEVIAAMPVEVGRLRRLREGRRIARNGSPNGSPSSK